MARCSGRENVLWHSQAIFRRPFTDGDIEPELARVRVAPFVSALQGVTTQILYRRPHGSRAKANDFVAQTCRMLFKGLR